MTKRTGKGRRKQAGHGAGGALAEALTPLIAGMTATLETQPSQRLEALEVLALFLDGVVVARQTVIVALGLTRDGQKVPLGLRLGSTENAVGALMLHAQRGREHSIPPSPPDEPGGRWTLTRNSSGRPTVSHLS